MESAFELPSINEHTSQKPESTKQVIICRGRSCRKYNAEEVLENFKQNLPTDVESIAVPCLGQCGNGPMVLVRADETWYSQVHPDEVKKVIQQHIMGKSPVKEMLYPKFHSR